MSDSLKKKSIGSRTYRERAQPAARQRLGILEKHSDYVLRAKDYHKKADRIKSLKSKAALKNPDEFYFGMVNGKTKDGVHVGERKTPRYDVKTLKTYKVQDGGYLRYHEDVNRAKIGRLEREAELVIEDSILPDTGPRKTVFVDEEGDVRGPVPLVSRAKGLPRRKDVDEEEEDDRRPSREKRELQARKERDAQLKKLGMEVDLQKALMGKGARKKIGEYPNGVPKYKWKQERKR